MRGAAKGNNNGTAANFGKRMEKDPAFGGDFALQAWRMKNLNLKKATRQILRGKPVIVAGVGFRCLAFRDQAGQLRNFWNEKILPLPVHILDPEI